MEVDARIIGQSTPKFAKQVSSKYGDLAGRKVQKDLSENHGRSISRTYIQDISLFVSEIIESHEIKEEWQYSLPQEALSAEKVSIGMDGTTSYVVKEGYRETMSGTIGFFDSQGDRVHTIYIAQTPEYGKMTFKNRLEKEINLVKIACPNADYTAVADGASDNWTFLDPFVNTSTLDYWHATEYLTPVSKIGTRLESKQKAWLKNACKQLKNTQGAAETLLEEMKELRSKRMSKTKKQKLEQSITYFKNHKHQMEYAKCVEKGLPIGSGVTEAACKVIVKERLCCSGMMWKAKGAQAVLNVRSLTHTEGRWEQFWKYYDKFGG